MNLRVGTAVLIIGMFLAQTSVAAIFGVDDRTLIRENSAHAQLASPTAVAVLNTLISETSPGFYAIETDSSNFLCKNDKFYGLSSLAYACSGFLIAPDILITAGHCMVNSGEVHNEKGLYCEAYSSWVFDYNVDSRKRPRTGQIPEKNHYKCKQIIYAVSDKENDYAIVQLDRPVEGRTPYKVSTAPLKKTDSFKMMGHPFGLPTVLTQKGRLLEDDVTKSFFVTNLDAFEGNSGSAVLNIKNEIVGLLISGSPTANTVEDKKRKCSIPNRCDEFGKNCLAPDPAGTPQSLPFAGSEVQRIAPILERVEKFQKSR